MVYEGAWQAQEIFWGYEHAAVALGPYSDAVTQEMATLIDQRAEAFEQEEYDLFVGPIYDNLGALQVAESQRATDEQLQTMDYLIQGVIELPPLEDQ
jgi:basic membrane protein A